MTRAYPGFSHFHHTEGLVKHIFLVQATTAIDPVRGELSDERLHKLVKTTIEEKLALPLPAPPEDAPDAIKQMVTLDQLGTMTVQVLDSEPHGGHKSNVIRFILRRQVIDTDSGAQIESFETFDVWLPSLAAKLNRGGYGQKGCNITTLVGVEVLPRCEHGS